MNSGQIQNKQFEILEKNLPLFPELWSQEQVHIWLNQIGMNQYQDEFSEMKIDGLIILDLTEQDLETELNITKKLHRKKIIKAIELLKTYTIFLQAKNQNQQNKLDTSFESDSESDQEQLTTVNEKENSLIEKDSVDQEFSTYYPLKHFLKRIQGENQSEIVFNEGDQIQIGNSNNCQLFLDDEFISKNHAIIKVINNEKTIQDMGSEFGTFLKVQQKHCIQEQQIFEIGSYFYQIKNIQISQKKLELQILNEDCFVVIKDQDIIGRNFVQNYLNQNDAHLSSNHCKFIFQDNQVFIEDLESTNGTWLRLSSQNEQSQIYNIKQGDILKFGNQQVYEYIEEEKIEKQKQNDEKCILCGKNDRNSLIIPCRHNSICYDCGQSKKNCPVCKIKVNDIIKMFLCQIIKKIIFFNSEIINLFLFIINRKIQC